MRITKPIGSLAAGAMLLAGAAFPAQAAEKITVCALTFVSSSPLFIAAGRGYYKAEGLDVQFKFFRAATPVAVGVVSGDCDFGVTGFTAGFFNLAGKGALKVIGAQSREEPGYNFVGFLASKKAYAAGLRSIKDLRGKRIGMTQIGSTFHYNMGMLADKYGWKISDFKLVALQSVPNMLAAVKSGQVDAIPMVGHIVKIFNDKGLAKTIGWVQEHTPWQLGGLFTSTSNVTKRRAMVEKFVRAYQKAASDYNEAFNRRVDGKRVFGDKAKALIPIIQKYTKAKPASIYAGAPFIDAMGRLKVKPILAQIAWYKKHGLVDKSVDAKSFIDLSFVKGHMEVPAGWK